MENKLNGANKAIHVNLLVMCCMKLSYERKFIALCRCQVNNKILHREANEACW